MNIIVVSTFHFTLLYMYIEWVVLCVNKGPLIRLVSSTLLTH